MFDKLLERQDALIDAWEVETDPKAKKEIEKEIDEIEMLINTECF